MLKLDLKQFSGGTNDRYKDPFGNVIYTGGVKYVADTAQANWLVDDICIYQQYKVVSKEPMQVWKLKVNLEEATGVLTCEDGNGNEVYRHNYPYTDFPEPELTLWLIDDGNTNRTLLLPEEY